MKKLFLAGQLCLICLGAQQTVNAAIAFPEVSQDLVSAASSAVANYSPANPGFAMPLAKGTVIAQAVTVATPVPEPATVLAALLLLLPFGASAFRIIRRNGKI